MTCLPNDSRRMTGRDKLFKDIQIVSFAMDDVRLFLDTHPNCAEALNYYRHYSQLYRKMVAEYTEKYGAIVSTYVNTEDGWSWLDTPWPWEREA